MNKNQNGHFEPNGYLSVKKTGTRSVGLAWKLKNVLRWSFLVSWLGVQVSRLFSRFTGVLTAYGTLEAIRISLNEEDRDTFGFMMNKARQEPDEKKRDVWIRDAQTFAWLNGQKINYGVLGYRSVTNAFVAFVTDQLQTETSVFGDFKYHDSGVGTTAENVTDTAMETTDGESRATGTQTESAANAYRSVGTISYTSTKAITEHGLFNDSSAGTLMDRTVFSAVNVVSGDSIQFTYTLTISAGG